MKKRDDNGRLQDILDAINRIGFYLRGSDEKRFADDLMRQDAIIRQIEIIGEAARHISPEFQEQHSTVPWFQMIGMRNRIVHDYADGDIREVWRTAKQDIPELKKTISKLIGER